MKTDPRVTSILKAHSLDTSITGFQTFCLSELRLANNLEFQLPTNLRLGHLAEKVVSQLLKSSTNYNVLYENLQIFEDKKTIGEIDFVIEEISTKKWIHLELAYKFYLLDPNISPKPINNWIGPNRNDSLSEKLEKLKTKQFPLLFQRPATAKLKGIDMAKVTQSLCFLVSLFVPFEYKTKLNPAYEKAIKGYYLNLETFIFHNHSKKTYYLPSKNEWGMDASENESWAAFKGVENQIRIGIEAQQAILCWQKHNGKFSTFFIVWW